MTNVIAPWYDEGEGFIVDERERKSQRHLEERENSRTEHGQQSGSSHERSKNRAERGRNIDRKSEKWGAW